MGKLKILNLLTVILYDVIIKTIIRMGRFRRCVEVHVSRVAAWTDKAGR